MRKRSLYTAVHIQRLILINTFDYLLALTWQLILFLWRFLEDNFIENYIYLYLKEAEKRENIWTMEAQITSTNRVDLRGVFKNRKVCNYGLLGLCFTGSDIRRSSELSVPSQSGRISIISSRASDFHNTQVTLPLMWGKKSGWRFFYSH